MPVLLPRESHGQRSLAGYSQWGCKSHPGSSPGSGRSPGEGNGNLHQYYCLENIMDRGAWQATVSGVARVAHDLATEPPPPP